MDLSSGILPRPFKSLLVLVFYLSKGWDDCRSKKRRGGVVDRVQDRAAEDEGDPVDVVAHFGDDLGKVLERMPLLARRHVLGRHGDADGVAVSSTVALEVEWKLTLRLDDRPKQLNVLETPLGWHTFKTVDSLYTLISSQEIEFVEIIKLERTLGIVSTN